LHSDGTAPKRETVRKIQSAIDGIDDPSIGRLSLDRSFFPDIFLAHDGVLRIMAADIPFGDQLAFLVQRELDIVGECGDGFCAPGCPVSQSVPSR
jgi:hypothetical protein